MIAQILNRGFLLEQMADLQRAQADPTPRRRGTADPHPELEPADYQAAAAALSDCMATETANSTGQPGFEPEPATRRDQTPPDLDDQVFISREPIAGNFQSALELYFLEGPGSGQLQQEVRPAGGRRGGAPEASPITDLQIEGAELQPGPPDRRLFNKFSVTDPGWLNSVFAMGVRKLRDRKDFVDRPATASPRPIANRCRLVLAGDWGSGLPRAIKVGAQMRKSIDAGLADNREVHVAHLGDVYYSGWKYEYEQRFFPHWPVRAAEAGQIGSYLLNGNHDMYSGGWAYYEALDEPRFKPYHQGSSFLGLANDHWQILGLDTAWEDHGLAGTQADWLSATFAAAPNKKNLLLSHHQLFSSHEKEGGKTLRAKIAPVLATGRVNAWFWGHEHRCLVYGPYEGVGLASCVGHAGVPVYVGKKAAGQDPPVLYEMRDHLPKTGLETWALFGHAVLDFDDAAVNAVYYDEDGREQFRVAF